MQIPFQTPTLMRGKDGDGDTASRRLPSDAVQRDAFTNGTHRRFSRLRFIVGDMAVFTAIAINERIETARRRHEEEAFTLLTFISSAVVFMEISGIKMTRRRRKKRCNKLFPTDGSLRHSPLFSRPAFQPRPNQ